MVPPLSVTPGAAAPIATTGISILTVPAFSNWSAASIALPVWSGMLELDEHHVVNAGFSVMVSTGLISSPHSTGRIFITRFPYPSC
jgi:hypothetical protein